VSASTPNRRSAERSKSAPKLGASARPSAQAKLAVGDIYLAALPELAEVEIEDLLPVAQTIKLKGRGWMEQSDFQLAIKARLGRAVYTEGLLGLKRKFVREA